MFCNENRFFSALAVLAALLFASSAAAQESTPDPAKRQIYFGEQYLHTQDSPDAFFISRLNLAVLALSSTRKLPTGAAITYASSVSVSPQTPSPSAQPSLASSSHPAAAYR